MTPFQKQTIEAWEKIQDDRTETMRDLFKAWEQQHESVPFMDLDAMIRKPFFYVRIGEQNRKFYLKTPLLFENVYTVETTRLSDTTLTIDGNEKQKLTLTLVEA